MDRPCSVGRSVLMVASGAAVDAGSATTSSWPHNSGFTLLRHLLVLFSSHMTMNDLVLSSQVQWKPGICQGLCGRLPSHITWMLPLSVCRPACKSKSKRVTGSCFVLPYCGIPPDRLPEETVSSCRKQIGAVPATVLSPIPPTTAKSTSVWARVARRRSTYLDLQALVDPRDSWSDITMSDHESDIALALSNAACLHLPCRKMAFETTMMGDKHRDFIESWK